VAFKVITESLLAYVSYRYYKSPLSDIGCEYFLNKMRPDYINKKVHRIQLETLKGEYVIKLIKRFFKEDEEFQILEKLDYQISKAKILRVLNKLEDKVLIEYMKEINNNPNMKHIQRLQKEEDIEIELYHYTQSLSLTFEKILIEEAWFKCKTERILSNS